MKKGNKVNKEINWCSICGIRRAIEDVYCFNSYCQECMDLKWDNYLGFPKQEENKLLKLKKNTITLMYKNKINIEKYEEVRKFLLKKHEESEELLKKKEQLKLNNLMKETDKLFLELKS